MEHEETFMKKAQGIFKMISDGLEIIMAVFVLIGILLAIVNLLFRSTLPADVISGQVPIIEYLERIFGIVIGIEFLAMLCKPDASNVLEVLIFLVARHMIVGHTTPYEDFVSVVSICLLVIVRRILHLWKTKAEETEHSKLRNAAENLKKAVTKES